MTTVNEILSEREQQYGQYIMVSTIAQGIKKIMRESPNYKMMPVYMQESLDMIANKLARILNGNYYHMDSWNDIAGYAGLAVMTSEDEENNS